MCYMDGNKKFVKKCCYEAYMLGSNNNYITYEQKIEINSKKKCERILLQDSNLYIIYEIKEKQFETIKFRHSYEWHFKRNFIMFNEYPKDTYKIMTNSEFKKYQKIL